MVHSKNICFARYKWRCSAEFAKEAMSNRSFTGSDCGEVLRVKWTYDDPNPVAQRREKRNLELEAATAIGEVHAKLPKHERMQREFLLGGEYPNTDEYYPDAPQQDGTSVQEAMPTAYPQYASDPTANVCFDVDEYPVFEVQTVAEVNGTTNDKKDELGVGDSDKADAHVESTQTATKAAPTVGSEEQGTIGKTESEAVPSASKAEELPIEKPSPGPKVDKETALTLLSGYESSDDDV